MSNLSPLTASDNTHVDCKNNCNDGLETISAEKFTYVQQQVIGDYFACNIWPVIEDHKPQGSLSGDSCIEPLIAYGTQPIMLSIMNLKGTPYDQSHCIR